jgi:predicted N-acyltransferase
MQTASEMPIPGRQEEQTAPTTCSHTCASSIDAVDIAAWERLCGDPDNPFMEVKFLRCVEQSMAGQAKVWYAILRDDGGEPAACACLTEFTVDLAIVAGSGVKKMIGAIRRVFPRLFFFKIMMCGLPVSNGQGSLRIAPGVDRASVLEQLDSMMRELAAKCGAKFLLFKEFTAAECEQMQSLLPLGYTLGQSLPMNMFGRKFNDFEQYLAALKAHYRQDIRRSKKKLDKAGLTLARIPGGPELEKLYSAEVHELYLAVVERAESKLEILPREFFLAMAREFRECISFTYIRSGERIVAFNWALRSGQAYRFMFCGIDYKSNEEAELYFNLMYAELDNGFRADVAAIEVGQTADLFKARLGCFQIPLAFYVKATIFQGLLRRSARFLFPERPPAPAYDIYRADPSGIAHHPPVVPSESAQKRSGPGTHL